MQMSNDNLTVFDDVVGTVARSVGIVAVVVEGSGAREVVSVLA